MIKLQTFLLLIIIGMGGIILFYQMEILPSISVQITINGDTNGKNILLQDEYVDGENDDIVQKEEEILIEEAEEDEIKQHEEQYNHGNIGNNDNNKPNKGDDDEKIKIQKESPPPPPPPVGKKKEQTSQKDIKEKLDRIEGKGFWIEYPIELRVCILSKIFFHGTNEMTEDEIMVAREELRVQMTCNKASDSELTEWKGDRPASYSFNRTFALLPSRHVSRALEVEIYPDEGTEKCTFTVISKSTDIQLHSDLLEPTYVILPSKTLNYCWHCTSLLHNKMPVANEFVLKDEKGTIYWGQNSFIILPVDSSKILYITPLDEVMEQYGEELIADLQFNAYLKSPSIIQALTVSYFYDRVHRGYAIVLSSRDPGEYQLVVTLNWYRATSEVPKEGEKPIYPILASSHSSHEFSPCDLLRSQIHSSLIQISISGVARVEAGESKTKCKSFDAAGRWVNFPPLSRECQPPYCEGDRYQALISAYSWQGTKYTWVWVPYDCYHHYYSTSDFAICAKKSNIKWIHVMGDSLAREIVGYLMSTMGIPDTHKFENADLVLNSTNVRLTFQSWQDIIVNGPMTTQNGKDHRRSRDFVEEMLDHYNLRKNGTSAPMVIPEIHLDLPDVETSRPDVFINNPAMAYTLYLQSLASYKSHVDDITDLLRQSIKNSHIKAFWYANPYVYGTAHAGTEFITQTRNFLFSSYTKEKVEEIGMRFLDPVLYTSSRPEESWDGLHYLRGYSQWNGHVAATIVQAILNELFGDCVG